MIYTIEYTFLKQVIIGSLILITDYKRRGQLEEEEEEEKRAINLLHLLLTTNFVISFLDDPPRGHFCSALHTSAIKG